MQNVKPGTEVVVDESMGKCIPMFEGTPKGILHLTKNNLEALCGWHLVQGCG